MGEAGIISRFLSYLKNGQQKPRSSSKTVLSSPTGIDNKKGGNQQKHEKAHKTVLSNSLSQQERKATDATPAGRAKIYVTGDKIDGKFNVIERLEEGGMGYVYIADDPVSKARFAVKQPNEFILSRKDLFDRAVNEADAWARLGMHPHIAYCYFVQQIKAVFHIFIEYFAAKVILYSLKVKYDGHL